MQAATEDLEEDEDGQGDINQGMDEIIGIAESMAPAGGGDL